MRYLICLLVALCPSASMICAQDQPKFSSAQQEVLDARKARVEAGKKRDGSWVHYVADDCIFSDDDGNLTTKAKMIEHDKTWPPEYDHSVNFRDYVVHVYGDTAVMNLRFTLHEQFTDSDIITEMRETETYVKQNGSWLLVARQWGPLPVNFHKPVAADTGVYKDYVGQFEWRPLDQAETVSVKDGKLWTDFGENADEEYFPLVADEGLRETWLLIIPPCARNKSLLSLPSAFSIGRAHSPALFFRVDHQPAQFPVFVTFIGEHIRRLKRNPCPTNCVTFWHSLTTNWKTST